MSLANGNNKIKKMVIVLENLESLFYKMISLIHYFLFVNNEESVLRKRKKKLQ